MRTARLVGAATVVLLVLAACGGDDAAPPSSTAEASATTSTTIDPMASPSVDGRFAVDAQGRELALRCWGDGQPVVVFDAGSGGAGIETWSGSPIVRDLAQSTQVCTYDRAGVGSSDEAPNQPRVLDDVVDDLHALLLAADVTAPYVLVGSSGGGFDIYHHAGRHPEEVAGLVMLDVPAGQATMSPADVVALAWDAPGNPEHVDYVAVERQMALDRLPIPPIPVTVISAESGQSEDVTTQAVWLEGSSIPRQVVLAGGHGIYDDDPEGVLAEIRRLLELVSGDSAP